MTCHAEGRSLCVGAIQILTHAGARVGSVVPQKRDGSRFLVRKCCKRGQVVTPPPKQTHPLRRQPISLDELIQMARTPADFAMEMRRICGRRHLWLRVILCHLLHKLLVAVLHVRHKCGQLGAGKSSCAVRETKRVISWERNTRLRPEVHVEGSTGGRDRDVMEQQTARLHGRTALHLGNMVHQS